MGNDLTPVPPIDDDGWADAAADANKKILRGTASLKRIIRPRAA